MLMYFCATELCTVIVFNDLTGTATRQQIVQHRHFALFIERVSDAYATLHLKLSRFRTTLMWCVYADVRRSDEQRKSCKAIYHSDID